jgi:hypothetical protein
MGDGAGGDRIAREAWEHHRQYLGPTHRTTLTQQVNVARRMMVTGQAGDAVAMLDGAVEGIADLEPANPVLLAHSRIALARALARSGDPGRARTVLDEVRPGLDELPEAVRRDFDQAATEAGA